MPTEHPTATRIKQIADELDHDGQEIQEYLHHFTDENQAMIRNQAKALEAIASQLRVLADRIRPHDFDKV